MKVLVLEVGAEDVAAVVGLRLEAGLVDLGGAGLEAAARPRRHHLHAIELRGRVLRHRSTFQSLPSRHLSAHRIGLVSWLGYAGQGPELSPG